MAPPELSRRTSPGGGSYSGYFGEAAVSHVADRVFIVLWQTRRRTLARRVKVGVLVDRDSAFPNDTS